MRQKWRDMGSPQTRQQKAFVHRFLSKLVFYRAFRKGPTLGFSNCSFHPLSVPAGLDGIPSGEFGSSEAVYQATRDPDNESYVQKHRQSKNPRVSRKVGEKHAPVEGWESRRSAYLSKILEIKLEQHPEVFQNLLRTGLREIIYNSKSDLFLGRATTPDGKHYGRNSLGKSLSAIRDRYLLNRAPSFRLVPVAEAEGER